LEPSCGSGQFIHYLETQFLEHHIHGVELQNDMFQSLSKKTFSSNVQLFHQDFLTFNNGILYDLIIGNPPYVVTTKKNVNKQYWKYCNGRPNLFCLFIIQSFSLLAEEGIMSFILPKSFLNSSYYEETRKLLLNNGNILNIIDYSDKNLFIETEQSTIGFIYQKTNNKVEPSFSCYVGKQLVFTNDLPILQMLLEGSTTIKEMGFLVKTGTVVWNQHKSILTNNSSNTLLLYNSNIVNNSIQLMAFHNKEKKQYIELPGSNDIVIVVNRGNGNNLYQLHYSLISLDQPYLVENHLNIIYSPENNNIDSLQTILHSFTNPKTEQFIRLFLGNNGLSKTELETMFPIYL
jgi:adenine-specific DNA-methyltransferase